jgi:hypothetical protein
MLTHRNLVANCQQMSCDPNASPDGPAACLLPMFHVTKRRREKRKREEKEREGEREEGERGGPEMARGRDEQIRERARDGKGLQEKRESKGDEPDRFSLSLFSLFPDLRSRCHLHALPLHRNFISLLYRCCLTSFSHRARR